MRTCAQLWALWSRCVSSPAPPCQRLHCTRRQLAPDRLPATQDTPLLALRSQEFGRFDLSPLAARAEELAGAIALPTAEKDAARAAGRAVRWCVPAGAAAGALRAALDGLAPWKALAQVGPAGVLRLCLPDALIANPCETDAAAYMQQQILVAVSLGRARGGSGRRAAPPAGASSAAARPPREAEAAL